MSGVKVIVVVHQTHFAMIADVVVGCLHSVGSPLRNTDELRNNGKKKWRVTAVLVGLKVFVKLSFYLGRAPQSPIIR